MQPLYKQHHSTRAVAEMSARYPWSDLHLGSGGWVEHHKWLMLLCCLHVGSVFLCTRNLLLQGVWQLQKVLFYKGEVHEELGLETTRLISSIYGVLLEGSTSFSGFSNLAQQSQMPILPRYRNQGTVQLNDTYFNIQPFSPWWKAMNKKPQHHYYLSLPKINLFTCKTDALKTNQPIEIISYRVGMWFAQPLERGNVLLSLNSLLMDAWWKVLETMYSAKRWGDRKWLLQRDIAQVSSARNSSPAALAPHMSSSVWKLNCKK